MPTNCGQQVSMIYIKWFLYAVGLLALTIATPILASYLLRWPACWKDLVVGPITAVVVVIYSYVAAPNFKSYCVIIGFLFGALIAYMVPDLHWYPECHAKAYTRTTIPLTITYLAGMFTLMIILYKSWKKLATSKT